MLDTDMNMMLFSFIMMRMAGCILMNPIFGRTNIPISVKSGMIFTFTLLVYSVSGPMEIEVDGNAIGYAVLLLQEFAAGYVLGAVFNFFLSAILYAGAVIDYQMGLSMSTIYDAQSNSSISMTSNLLNMIFIICFLTTDAHLTLLRIFLSSADIVPYGTITLGPEAAAAALAMFSQFMSLILRLAMPMLAVLLFVEVGVGILMKTIPQINIFVINIQAKILIGLVIFLILFFPMADFLLSLVNTLIQSMSDLLGSMRG